MSHALATTPAMIAAICSAMNGTTLNGGTVTCVANPGNHTAVLTINTDSTGAYTKIWELVLR